MDTKIAKLQKFNRREFLTALMALASSITLGINYSSAKAAKKSKVDDLTQRLEELGLCISLDEAMRELATENFELGYAHFLENFVTSEGVPIEDALRVFRRENENDTVSEGMAYGMIASAFSGDQTTFEKFWRYCHAYMAESSSGLMPWRIDSAGTVIDIGAATDADLDMAYALLVAGVKFENEDYLEAGYSMITKIIENEVEPGTSALKPGPHWGGSDITNPSYFTPAFFEIFARVTQDERWINVATKCRTIFDNLYANQGEGEEVLLPPNWLTAEGTIAPDYMGDQRNLFAYDALRIPLRQVLLLLICEDEEALRHAYLVLEKINRHFEAIGPGSILDGYDIHGNPTGQYHNAPFVASAAAASVVSSNVEYRMQILQELITTTDNLYYNMTIRMLTFLLLSGKMQDVV